MIKINTGGPAFPSVLYTHEKGPNHHDEGMTLRDYAAMLGEAQAFPHGSLDREYRIRAAWTLDQISRGVAACDWTDTPPQHRKAA
jgi:hypothetical protein